MAAAIRVCPRNTVAHAAPLRDFSLPGRQISCWRHCSGPTSHTRLAGGPAELDGDQVAPSTTLLPPPQVTLAAREVRNPTVCNNPALPLTMVEVVTAEFFGMLCTERAVICGMAGRAGEICSAGFGWPSCCWSG